MRECSCRIRKKGHERRGCVTLARASLVEKMWLAKMHAASPKAAGHWPRFIIAASATLLSLKGVPAT